MTYYETYNNPKPTIKELEHLLKNDPRVHQKKAYKQALELKLQAIKQEPSPIEKTMTALQLFQTQSPFWANGLTLKRINDILTVQKDIKTDIFFENLNKLIEFRDDRFYLLAWTLRLNHGN